MIAFETEESTADSVPFLRDEDTCAVDGCENPIAPYAGKGRKPTKCVEHKGSRGNVTAVKATGVANNKKAQRAAERLCELNDLIGMVLMVPAIDLPETAKTIAMSREGFKEEVYAALVTDDKLCDMILRGGAMTGRMALAAAYGMFAFRIGTVAMAEKKLQAQNETE